MFQNNNEVEEESGNNTVDVSHSAVRFIPQRVRCFFWKMLFLSKRFIGGLSDLMSHLGNTVRKTTLDVSEQRGFICTYMLNVVWRNNWNFPSLVEKQSVIRNRY